MSDPRLIPLTALTAALLATSAQAAWGLRTSRRNLAWSVVDAALVLRQMGPAAVAQVEQAVHAARVPGRSSAARTQATLQDLPAPVRRACCAIGLHRRGVATPDAAPPCRTVGSAHRARPAAQHIRAVRFHTGLQHGLERIELGPLR